jgi:hypothetical protein
LVEVSEFHDTPNWAVVINWVGGAAVDGDITGPKFQARIVNKRDQMIDIIGDTPKEVAAKVLLEDPKAKFNLEKSIDPASEETADDYLARLKSKPK